MNRHMLAQFILTLREGLEAALTIAIVPLTEIGEKDLHRFLWLGGGLAVTEKN